MRGLVLEEPGRLGVRPVAVPGLRPGDVLVRVEAATTCGTDLKAFQRGHRLIPMPGVLGHEYSGIVESIGEGAGFEVGQAVMGVHSAPCQACYWCMRGQENLCELLLAGLALGSFAERLLVPAHVARLNLFPKPASLSFERACLLEPLACVMQGVSMLPLRPDSSVLVIGPGAIGLLFVGALKAQGVETVCLAGRNPGRLEVGAGLGAETVAFDWVRPHQGRGYDVVIECTGQVSVWERSVGWARRGGTVMLFGGPPGGTCASFDTHRLHYDQITLISPFHFGSAAVRAARELLVGGRVDFAPLLSGERALEDGPAVFADLAAGRGIKYVFRP